MKLNIKHETFPQDHIYLYEKNLPNCFELKDNRLFLNSSCSRPIKINLPLKLDENLARIAGMIMDGSLSKNLSAVSFFQKKDRNKPIEFANIINGLFNVSPLFRNVHGVDSVKFCSKVLGTFLHKSDQDAHIPYWIWHSPKSVVVEYLRYAFAMEGSVYHYLKTTEIKFHSVDLSYIHELKKLLNSKFDIKSYIQTYYVTDYGWKYYLYFSKQEDIIKFGEIGFALKSHEIRLNQLISSFKNKSWEITLASLHGFKGSFTISDVTSIFPYLCRRAVHERISLLVKMDYLFKRANKFYLNSKGKHKAELLIGKVKFTKLRTNPKQNEEAIINFLKKNCTSYRNELARELKINAITIKDCLKRLVKNNQIVLTKTDQFQRRFFQLLN